MASGVFNRNEQLRSQVYEYIRSRLVQGEWKAGESINVGEIVDELGISKTPLRDALIKLEAEGFVTILPQRGVIIKDLAQRDVQEIFEILGALESRVVLSVFHKIGEPQISEFKRLDEKMLSLIAKPTFDFKVYNQYNVEYHNIFIRLSDNQLLLKQVRNLKRRLYDFPNRDYGATWQHVNVVEHQQFVQLVEKGNAKEASDFLRDVHWIFRHPESFGQKPADKSVSEKAPEGNTRLVIKRRKLNV